MGASLICNEQWLCEESWVSVLLHTIAMMIVYKCATIFRILMDNFEDMAPIIYTPTVGWACSHFSHLYR